MLEAGISRLRNELGTAPPEVTDCVRDVVGTENLERILAGDLLPGPEIGDQVRYCFENLAPFGPGDDYHEGYEEYREDYYGGDEYHEDFEEPQGFYEDYEFEGEPYYDEYPKSFDGPGGCRTSDECFQYCSDPAHWEECGKSVSDIEPQYIEEEYHDDEHLPQADEPHEEYVEDETPVGTHEEEYREESPDNTTYDESYEPPHEEEPPHEDEPTHEEPASTYEEPEPTHDEGQLLPAADSPSFFGLIFLGIQNLLSI